jgi:hypothetical protein
MRLTSASYHLSLTSTAIIASPMKRVALAAVIKSEIPYWAKVIKDADIKQIE